MGCFVVNDVDVDVCEVTDLVVTDGAASAGVADFVVTTVVVVADSIVDGIDCVGVNTISTGPLVCVVNAVAIDGVVCVGVVTDLLCVGVVL